MHPDKPKKLFYLSSKIGFEQFVQISFFRFFLLFFFPLLPLRFIVADSAAAVYLGRHRSGRKGGEDATRI